NPMTCGLSAAGRAMLLITRFDRLAGGLALVLIELTVAVAVEFFDDRGTDLADFGLELRPGCSAFVGVELTIFVGVESFHDLRPAFGMSGLEGLARRGTFIG